MIDLTPNIATAPDHLRPRPTNAQPHPTGVGQGFARHPVIAHLVWPDREELRAAIATGWTDQIVHVRWSDGAAWLPLDDVRRVIQLPVKGSAEYDG